MNTNEVLDFHKLTPTALKIHYEKVSPKILTYRDYKHFSNKSFHSDVLNEIERYHDFSFTDFKQECAN